MARLGDLIGAAEEAVLERKIAKANEADVFQVSNPEFFPTPPSTSVQTEELRQQMRQMFLSSHYYAATVVLGYTKLRPEPHGELCSFLDFVEDHEELNRSIMYMPRDTYKTTIGTITRAIKRGCKDPNTRGLIVADTGANSVRFGTEIKNQFQFNALLHWLFPEVIPESFSATRWNANELVLRRSALWREPTFDFMGAGGGIESRHYDWIIADDLVTEKHIHSDLEMDRLSNWIPGLEPLLVNDVEGLIDFVGSRKKKGDSYEFVEKYFGAGKSMPIIVGPHAVKKGVLVIYSRSIIEEGKIIFPYIKKEKSGISMAYITRMRTFDPERYHAQLANDPKGSGLNWFRGEDIRYFRMDEDGIIEAIHDGKLVERTSVWQMQRIVLYDPSVAEKDSSSKNAIHLVAKGNSGNRYVIKSRIGHFPPDEVIQYLFELNRDWYPEFFSIEKRGFQGWVRKTLDLIAELLGLPMIPVMSWPQEGSERAQWQKKEHIRTLQPIVRNHLLWLNEEDVEQVELAEDIASYPNVRYDDALDGLAQGTDWWPFSFNEAEEAAKKEAELRFLDANLRQGYGGRAADFLLSMPREPKPFSEAEFLAQFDASGYGMKSFNN